MSPCAGVSQPKLPGCLPPNRFWGYYMGRGLVEPLDDVRATNPASNPELLDEFELTSCRQKSEASVILTGRDVEDEGLWKLDRHPSSFETSLPGVFAVGDVRRGSVKRVASAVGEGSVVIQAVHEYLHPNEIETLEKART